MSEWKPRIQDGNAPLYERIADALEADIEEQRLLPGDQLPPHRDLARLLSISPGTVAKAYQTAETRGLVNGHVGRGSFVTRRHTPRQLPPALSGSINLSRNIPPALITADRLRQAMGRLQRRPDVLGAIAYPGPQGSEQARWAGAEWLRGRHGIANVQAADLVQCNGALHALSLILTSSCAPGDTVLCEPAIFHAMKTLADALGLRLCGIAMDNEGILPDALEDAARQSGAKALYVIPTLQNPTTISYSARRRKDIADVARKHDLLIIEDDTYRALADAGDRPPTIAQLAPERSFYIATLSKVLTPGLRLSFVLAPPDRRDALLHRIAATGFSQPPFGGFLFAQWVEDGTAYAIAEEVAGEARRRTALARGLLGGIMAEPAGPQSLHIWLPLPPLEAERVAGRALRAGVEVTPADAPIVDSGAISGLRVCLGSVDDIELLAKGLRIIALSTVSEVGESLRAFF